MKFNTPVLAKIVFFFVLTKKACLKHRCIAGEKKPSATSFAQPHPVWDCKIKTKNGKFMDLKST